MRHVLKNGNVYSIAKVKGFVPKNSIGILPDSFLREDYQFLQVIDVPDPVTGELRKTFGVDQAAKDVAVAERLKKETVKAKYEELNGEVYAEMERVFYTSKSDSATANYEMWKHMVANASLYTSQGLKAEKQLNNADDTELYSPGSALDTESKIVAYAERKIVEADNYIVWRSNRIQQFRNERDALLGA